MTLSPPRSTAIPSDDELSALIETMPVSGSRRSIALLATVATFGSLLSGCGTRVIVGALPYMYMLPTADDLGLNEFDEGLVGITLAFGVALGAILGGRIPDSRGRRFNIFPLVGVFTITVLDCTFSPSVPVLPFFRLILGWAVGGASATVSIYLSKSTPTRVRDQLVALGQFMIVFGQLLIYLMDAVLARGHGGFHVTVDPTITQSSQLSWDQVSTMTDIVILSGSGAAWRWMFVLATIPTTPLWVGMRLIPESGHWYAANLHYIEAIDSLKQIHDPERDGIVDEIYEIVDLHEYAKSEGTWSFSRTMRMRWMRRLAFIGIGLTCFDQSTDISTAMYYLPKILRAAGLSTASPISLNVIVGAAAILGTAFGLWLVGRLKRRYTDIYQESGVTFSLSAPALVFTFGITLYTLSNGSISADVPSTLPWLVLALVSLFVFARQSGTMNWVLVSGISPPHIRDVAQGFAVGCDWLMDTLVSHVFPVMITHLGAAWAYTTFGAVNVVALCFYLFIVPETKGTFPECLEEDFTARYGR